jgi:imidazolonepropionase-like amidohydrolase
MAETPFGWEVEMQGYAETNFVDNYEPGDDALVELKNGRFVDAINGRYFAPETRVIIQGKKVKAMPGMPGEPTGIKPDFTIDLQGKSVFPGIFNTHCHASYTTTTVSPEIKDVRLGNKYHQQQLAKNMAECLAHGITNIRDCKIDDLRILRAWKERISRGEIEGPRIYQAVVVTPPNNYFSPRLTFTWRFFCMALGIPVVEYQKSESGVLVFPLDANARQVRDAVDRAIDERGAEYIKIGEQIENLVNFKPTHTVMTTRQLEALADQARRRGLKSTMHQVSVESFRRGVKAGVSSLAHIPCDADLSEADVKAFIAAKCISEPTLSVAYDVVWRVKGHPSYDHPEVLKIMEFRDKTIAALAEEFFVPELRGSVLGSHQRLSQGIMKTLGMMDNSAMYRFYAGAGIHGTHNFRLLFEKNARMGCGNDGGIPPCTPAAIKYEMGMFDLTLNRDRSARRFTGADALRLATIGSAEAMGLEEGFGSIRTGKVADLAIVAGDPLADWHIVGSRVAALFYDGKLKINNCGLTVEKARRP